MPHENRGTFECPNCGAEVPMDSIACPECGSDDDTGWSSETEYNDLDLHAGYGDDEVPDEASRQVRWVRYIIVALIVLLGILMLVNV